MNVERIIRAAIPDADDATIAHVLWERTPYPVGAVTPQGLYRAASRLRRAEINRVKLCQLCDNAVTAGKYECNTCLDALERARQSRRMTR